MNFCVAAWVQSRRNFVEGEEIGPDGFKTEEADAESKPNTN
jgi:hypothetical protein